MLFHKSFVLSEKGGIDTDGLVFGFCSFCFSVENMSKRRGEGDYSSSSNEKQKANKSHGMISVLLFHPFISYIYTTCYITTASPLLGNFDLDDSSHKEFDSLDAEVELHTEVVQKLSESVVSLSFIGNNTNWLPIFAFDHQF